MLTDRNQAQRLSFAGQIVTTLSFGVFSFLLGQTFDGRILWVLLAFNYVLAAMWQSISNLIVATRATAKLENWKETLTDRFALDEIFEGLAQPGPRNFNAIWDRASNRATEDILVHHNSRIIDSPWSTFSGCAKLMIVTIFWALVNVVVCVVPALLAKNWN
jgi:hypothetical protein